MKTIPIASRTNVSLKARIMQKGIILAVCAFLSILNYDVSHAQISAPSLGVGVDGVTAAKGQLDVNLISEIVSLKQTELKKAFIHHAYTELFKNQSYALWEYTYNMTDLLLNTNGKEVAKKNALEFTANIGLTYGITSFYVQASNQEGNKPLQGFYELFDPSIELDIGIPNSNPKDYLSLASFGEVRIRFKDSTIKTSDGEKKDTVIQVSKPENIKPRDFNEDFYANMVLLDMVYDILQKNPKIMQLGFFESHRLVDHSFSNAANSYHRFYKLHAPGQNVLDKLYRNMNKQLDLLINNYYLISQMIGRYNKLPEWSSLKRVSLNSIDSGLDVLKSIKHDLSSLKIRDSALSYEELYEQISDGIKRVSILQTRLSGKDSIGPTMDDLYYMDYKGIPLLTRLTTSFGLDSKYLSAALNVQKMIRGYLIEKLADSVLGETELYKGLKELKLRSISPALRMITSLHNMDIANSYEHFINVLQGLDEITSSPKFNYYIKSITEGINRFTIINEKQNSVEMDVEEVIVHLYQRFENRRYRPVYGYFSVGINQSIYTSDSLFQGSGWVGEKIGIKIPIYDFKRRRSFGINEKIDGGFARTQSKSAFRNKEPLISDVHAVVYGSGLLYNITNLTTNENIEGTMLGAGFGLTSFNHLDFNITYNVPLQSKYNLNTRIKDHGILAFSFDIKFIEYLNALQERRKQNNP